MVLLNSTKKQEKIIYFLYKISKKQALKKLNNKEITNLLFCAKKTFKKFKKCIDNNN